MTSDKIELSLLGTQKNTNKTDVPICVSSAYSPYNNVECVIQFMESYLSMECDAQFMDVTIIYGYNYNN